MEKIGKKNIFTRSETEKLKIGQVENIYEKRTL